MDKQVNQTEMFRMVEQWQASGKRQIDYYRENQIKPFVFYYWLRKYRERNSPVGFIPVRVSKKKHDPPIGTNIEIRYPNGTILQLPATISLSTIRQLIGM
jgi:hypothetical protein